MKKHYIHSYNDIDNYQQWKNILSILTMTLTTANNEKIRSYLEVWILYKVAG